MSKIQILLFSYLVILVNPAFGAKICYFSLNNEKEFKEMGKLTRKLNKYSKEKIEIQEFLTSGDNPEKAFEEMVKSGVKCDGLVISGHHTGSFGGKRANGGLGIDFMEKLSCNEDNKEFFSHVKALWLQGCRTLGVGRIEAYESVDQHMGRVGDVLTEDHLERSFADLNMEFSATLDQDNPLSSRYLRVFPRATTFGWTKTAPGEKARSQFSIPFHIAQMARITDDRKRYFQNPTRKLSKRSARKYLQALEQIIGRDLTKGCEMDRDESDSVQAWINHGNRRKVGRYAFQNSDLNAYESLLKSDNPKIITAKKIDCLLKELKSVDTVLKVLDQLLKDETLIGYSFNSLYELIQRFSKEGNIDALVKIQRRLDRSPELNHFLMRKLASKELGILRRIDYYAFWRDMTGKKNKNIEEVIRKAFLKFATSPTNDDYNRIDFIETLTQSMIKHGLIKPHEYKQFVELPEVNATTLGALAVGISRTDVEVPDADNLFLEMINSPKADDYLLGTIAEAVGNTNFPLQTPGKLLRLILDSPKSTAFALDEILSAIGDSEEPIPNAIKLIKDVIKSPKANTEVLYSAAKAIVESEDSIEGISEMLMEIVQSPKSDAETLSSVASAIEISKAPVLNAEKILHKIISSPNADAKTLASVVQTIQYSKNEIKGATKILMRVIKSPKASNESISSIAEVIEYSERPVTATLINMIVRLPDLDESTLLSIQQSLENAEQSIPNSEKLLEIVDRKIRSLVPIDEEDEPLDEEERY